MLTVKGFSLRNGKRHVNAMFLRAYKRDDKRAVQQVFYDSVHGMAGAHFTSSQVAEWAKAVAERELWNDLDECFTYVVEANKQVIGFASMNANGVLEWLYVHPEHQSRGVATALIRQMERVARKNGFAAIAAAVSLNARIFFERIGFEPTEQPEQPATQQNPFAHLLMTKKCPSGRR